MTWIIAAYYQKVLEFGDHQLCPHCEKNGEAQLNACERHKWAWKWWFERTFPKLGECEVAAPVIEVRRRLK